MREILFRGKDADGKWHYGCLLTGQGEQSNGARIISRDKNIESWVAVFKETVGQFTGLLDKNGAKIFEGDIVDSWANFENGPYFREVIYSGESEMCGLVFKPLTGFTLCKNNEKHFEVVDNIHDNPTLLKAEV